MPLQVMENWDITTVVFVAHCVHWRPILSWKHWDRPKPPSLLNVVRQMHPLVDRQAQKRRLTVQAAATFFSFSGGILKEKLGEAGPLPDGWDTGFEHAIALPVDDKSTKYRIIKGKEGN
ncbi:MAG: hypothetical protein JO287_24275 [Pseudonocardiales bacterium]|nr:hypothetical protein [Pseudonocardiales bacterium]